MDSNPQAAARRDAIGSGSGDFAETDGPRYQPGSGGYPAADRGSESNQPGSGGYPAAERGSEGYQPGSGEPTPARGSHDQTPDHDADDLSWRLAEAEARRERRKALREPGVWLPGGEDLDQDPRIPSEETGFSVDSRRSSEQVGVRLTPTHFQQLCEVAELYGVRPTTLARMMVIRGVKAVLDAELRRKGELLRGP